MTAASLGPDATRQKVLAALDRLIFGLLVVFLAASAFSIAVSEIGYFSAFVLWIGRMYYTQVADIPPTPFDRLFLAYFAAEILATLFADRHLYSLNYLQRRMLLLPIPFVMLASVSTRKGLSWLAGAMIASAFGVAMWSLIDILVNIGDFIHYHRRLGEFQIYMTAAGIMMINLLVVCAFLSHPKLPRKYRLVGLGVAAPLAINLLFTFTRSSWLGFLCGIIVIVAKRSRKILIPLGAALLVVALLAPPEMKQRFMSIFDPNHPDNVSRVNMWKTGVRIIEDHPLFGIGDVGTETVWNRYSDPGWTWEGHLHNNLIMWLVTLGAVGCTVIVWIFVRMWRVFSRIERKFRDDWLAGSLALGGLAVIVGFQVNGLFEWNFGDAEIITLMWAILGLVLVADNVIRPPGGSPA